MSPRKRDQMSTNIIRMDGKLGQNQPIEPPLLPCASPAAPTCVRQPQALPTGDCGASAELRLVERQICVLESSAAGIAVWITQARKRLFVFFAVGRLASSGRISARVALPRRCSRSAILWPICVLASSMPCSTQSNPSEHGTLASARGPGGIFYPVRDRKPCLRRPVAHCKGRTAAGTSGSRQGDSKTQSLSNVSCGRGRVISGCPDRMNRSRKPIWKRHRSPASHHAGTSYKEPDASARLPRIRRHSTSATAWSSPRFSVTCPGVITSGGNSCCCHCSRKAIAKRKRESSLRREPLGCVFRTALASVSWSPSELCEARQRSSRMRAGRSSKRRASVSVSMRSRRNDGSL